MFLFCAGLVGVLMCRLGVIPNLFAHFYAVSRYSFCLAKVQSQAYKLKTRDKKYMTCTPASQIEKTGGNRSAQHRYHIQGANRRGKTASRARGAISTSLRFRIWLGIPVVTTRMLQTKSKEGRWFFARLTRDHR